MTGQVLLVGIIGGFDYLLGAMGFLNFFCFEEPRRVHKTRPTRTSMSLIAARGGHGFFFVKKGCNGHQRE